MTRTGLAAELCRHAPEPFVEIHPADAAPLGIAEGQLTRVATRQGEAVAVARLTDRQRRGSVFLPMHWTEVFAAEGRANPLVAPRTDPRSGQPEFKHTPARVYPYRETWRGFFLAREPAAAQPGLIWRRIPQAACQLHEFAGRGDEDERAALRKRLTRTGGRDVLRYEDPATSSLREAWFDGGRLDRVLFLTTGPQLPPRDWLAELFAQSSLSAQDRAALLIGRAPGRPLDTSPLVCACRGVRLARITAAVAAGAATLDALGEATTAGAACGSCRPELARLIAAAAEPARRVA